MPYDQEQDSLNSLKKDYAETTKRTVFFIGAGGSAEVGLPSWSKLADIIYERLDQITPETAKDDELLENFLMVDKAYQSGDFWEMFDLVETHWHGFYEDLLNTEFSADRMQSIDIPVVYKKIWEMRNVGQVMTLNIDGLLARAYDSIRTPTDPKLMEYPGVSATDSQRSFSKNHPTLLNLHGVHSARSTWVMSKKEREHLFTNFKTGGYKRFLGHLFSTYNIVFVGVNLLDEALSPIIEELNGSNLLTHHYWITANISADANRWAQKNSVRVINYTPETDQGGTRVDSPVICAILEDIEKFESFDQEKLVLPELERVPGEGFPEPDELILMLTHDREKAVALLSGRLEDIGQEFGFNKTAMSTFLRKYDIPIQLALVIGKVEPHNKVLGRKLLDQISTSQTSSVWLVEETNSQSYQILKFLSAQALASLAERESFRRGIESLFLLKDSDTSIAPKYITHTNVPLAAVMEQIEGESLEEIRKGRRDVIKDHWLEIFTKVCTAVADCHTSEGRVLHRDLKPQNILLSGVGWDVDAQDIKNAGVKLINFDMSWHKLSSGDTKSISADEVGYYAPEQRSFINSESPRNAKTDVYMLGMILYSLISTDPPPEGGSKILDWKEMVERKIHVMVQDRLVANRTARLILRMTAQETKDRPDMREVITELETIAGAVNRGWEDAEPELFVEKLLVDAGVEYDWFEQEMMGRVISASAYNLELSFANRGSVVKIYFERERDPAADKRNFSKRLKEHVNGIKSDLQGHGWSPNSSSGYDNAVLSAQKKIKDLQEDVEASVTYVSATIHRLMQGIQ